MYFIIIALPGHQLNWVEAGKEMMNGWREKRDGAREDRPQFFAFTPTYEISDKRGSTTTATNHDGHKV